MSDHPSRLPLPPTQLAPGGFWTELAVVEETGSTNADVAEAARAGAAEGLVLVAEHQRAGRGRAGRTWSSPPRAGLAVSVLLRPGQPGRPGTGTEGLPPAPLARWGWLPLLTGVALAETVARVTGVDASLKWPNDLLVDGRKCAGILVEVAERAGQEAPAVVVGIGLNVTLCDQELPPPSPDALPATSLALAGAATTDRSALLRELLCGLSDWYERWRAAGGDAEACGLRGAYLRWCGTLDRPIRVRLPDRTELAGTANTVDAEGRLVLRTAAGDRTLSAGDVTHLRC